MGQEQLSQNMIGFSFTNAGALVAPFNGYKGYGLSIIVNILTGLLSGASLGHGNDGSVNENIRNVGYNFAALDISRFQNIDEFKSLVDIFADRLLTSPKKQNEECIYVPGEKEFANADEAMEKGIELFEGVAADLDFVGEAAGLTRRLEDCIVVNERI